MAEPVGPEDEDPYAKDPPDALLAEADYYLPYAVCELREIARRKAALAAEELPAVVRLTAILGAAAAAELAAVAAGAAFSVFLTDTAGRLNQAVNLRARPGGEWTREELTAAVQAALQAEPPTPAGSSPSGVAGLRRERTRAAAG
jgi:hypothetical protein